MKKSYYNLVSTIEYLKENHAELPVHVFDSLNEAKDKMYDEIKKKRCDQCDRYEHYNEVMGIWNCDQCDKYPKKD